VACVVQPPGFVVKSDLKRFNLVYLNLQDVAKILVIFHFNLVAADMVRLHPLQLDVFTSSEPPVATKVIILRTNPILLETDFMSVI
jgi:hypothetical protein